MDGPKASSFGDPNTLYVNLNLVDPSPLIETIDSVDLDSIQVASAESPDYCLELDDPSDLSFTCPPLTGDLDFQGVISSPTFNFF